MKKVLILNHHAKPPSVGGGGRHYQLGSCLNRKGYTVDILTSSFDQNSNSYIINKNSRCEIEELNNSFRFVLYKTKPKYRGNAGRFLNYIDFMRKTKKYKSDMKVDIVIGSSVHPLAWISGYKIAKRYNAKFIVEVRDLWPLSMYEDLSNVSRKIIFPFFEYLEKKYYELADAIVTTAPYAWEYMDKYYGIEKEKIFHIPHGIDIMKFDLERDSQYINIPDEINNVLEKNKCITYTGSLSKSEGLATLVSSARYINSNVNILIIGNGNELEKLENIKKKYHLNNVYLFSRINKNIIPKVLSKSDILFTGLISRKAFEYGISKNKFYDYMASGKPIIFASDVRDSLIEKSSSGLTIQPNDAKKLAQTINYIIDSPTIGAEYGKNGRKYVETYHNNEYIAEKFISVFNYVERGSKND